MNSTDGTPLMTQIAKAEQEIEEKYARLQLLKHKLRNEELPESKKKAAERELEEVAKLLNTSKEQLAHLRTHNRQSFMFVVALVFIIFMVYMMYIMVNGSQF